MPYIIMKNYKAPSNTDTSQSPEKTSKEVQLALLQTETAKIEEECEVGVEGFLFFIQLYIYFAKVFCKGAFNKCVKIIDEESVRIMMMKQQSCCLGYKLL